MPSAHIIPFPDRKIVTDFIYPPIPVRTMDWIAYAEGEEERHHYGYGKTEADAIEDLLTEYPDEFERVVFDRENYRRLIEELRRIMAEEK